MDVKMNSTVSPELQYEASCRAAEADARQLQRLLDMLEKGELRAVGHFALVGTEVSDDVVKTIEQDPRSFVGALILGSRTKISKRPPTVALGIRQSVRWSVLSDSAVSGCTEVQDSIVDSSFLGGSSVLNSSLHRVVVNDSTISGSEVQNTTIVRDSEVSDASIRYSQLNKALVAGVLGLGVHLVNVDARFSSPTTDRPDDPTPILSGSFSNVSIGQINGHTVTSAR